MPFIALNTSKSSGQQGSPIASIRNLDQQTIAQKAGISLRGYQRLELGSESSVETLVRALKALDFLKCWLPSRP